MKLWAFSAFIYIETGISRNKSRPQTPHPHGPGQQRRRHGSGNRFHVSSAATCRWTRLWSRLRLHTGAAIFLSWYLHPDWECFQEVLEVPSAQRPVSAPAGGSASDVRKRWLVALRFLIPSRAATCLPSYVRGIPFLGPGWVRFPWRPLRPASLHAAVSSRFKGPEDCFLLKW